MLSRLLKVKKKMESLSLIIQKQIFLRLSKMLEYSNLQFLQLLVKCCNQLPNLEKKNNFCCLHCYKN